MIRFSGILSLLIIFVLSAHAAEQLSENNDSTQTIIVIDTSKQTGDSGSISAEQADTSLPVSKNGNGTEQASVSLSENQAGSDTVQAETSLMKTAAKNSAVLVVSSEPQGAALLLNDSVVGVTPVTLSEIIPGKHTLTFKIKGYYQKKAEIAITTTDTQRVHLEMLKPASIYYISDPAGAQLSLNGAVKGVTPFLDKQVKPGEYKAELTLADYQSADTTLSISNGVVDTLSFVLKAATSPVQSKKSSASDSSSAAGSQKEPSKLRRYSGIIGAVAFAVFAAIVLIGERSDF